MLNLQAGSETVHDYLGNVMFFCSSCGEPLTKDDFFEQGLRLPEQGESRDEYCDAELLDGTTHIRCLRAAHAG